MCLPRKPSVLPPLVKQKHLALRAPAPALRMQKCAKPYRMQFSSGPPSFTGVMRAWAQEESTRVLREESHSLLSKGAISIVPPVFRAASTPGIPGSQRGGLRFT